MICLLFAGAGLISLSLAVSAGPSYWEDLRLTAIIILDVVGLVLVAAALAVAMIMGIRTVLRWLHRCRMPSSGRIPQTLSWTWLLEALELLFGSSDL